MLLIMCRCISNGRPLFCWLMCCLCQQVRPLEGYRYKNTNDMLLTLGISPLIDIYIQENFCSWDIEGTISFTVRWFANIDYIILFQTNIKANCAPYFTIISNLSRAFRMNSWNKYCSFSEPVIKSTNALGYGHRVKTKQHRSIQYDKDPPHQVLLRACRESSFEHNSAALLIPRTLLPLE